MKDLRNRVVLVTGASSGIGFQTALEFARQGCRVAACARREDRLGSLQQEIRAAGSESMVRVLDVSDRAGMMRFAGDIVAAFGKLDIAVANAGYGYLSRVENIEPEKLNRIWEVNVLGSLWTLQAAIPHMRRQGEGHLVLVSSVIGRYALPLSGAYCVTKSSQSALGQALRPELKRHNIRVTMVYPGFTATEFGEKQIHAERRKKVARKSQSAEDVARRMVRAVERNKKEVYPSFSGSLFAHFGLWLPWLVDEALARVLPGMEAESPQED